MNLRTDRAAWERLLSVLRLVLSYPTGSSSLGHPYLERRSWEVFRDRVPHLLGMGTEVLLALEILRGEVKKKGLVGTPENFERGARVIRQIVLTAAITAPGDLWLLHHVLGTMGRLGLLRRLSRGVAIYPEACRVKIEGSAVALDARELATDLRFLLSRGLVEEYDDSFRMAGHPRVRALFEGMVQVSDEVPMRMTAVWRRLFSGETLDALELEALLELSVSVRARTDTSQNHWIPTLEEVELGYRLLPLVLGLRACGMTEGLLVHREISPSDWSARHPVCAAGGLEILTAAGWTERRGDRYCVTELGERSFAKGPGPFGIIETYSPYMQHGAEILLGTAEHVWVQRGENVGASQDANRSTFQRANKSLDRLCEDTGFRYTVFIEHAIGRGEATRQRFAAPGGDTLRYFGADLEDASIDAAQQEQRLGRLPANMTFVRQADIGEPEILIGALRAAGVDPAGAVMLVGNGFHEVRNQTDEAMVEVFRGYQDAGIVLLFTEESALSIDDLRATAWNTYHAGFKYVHEKSGQGLRPADPRPPVRLGLPLRASWSTCAQEAGYVRADRYSTRTRTIYPYPPPSGYNPSISVNHFFIPAAIARALGVGE